ncbi:hypothetical protein XBKB1_4140072 [Xenorhabdus bovienii str. kraussei Becker Underwood]|uniref:Uncharacterized protein n=1 Tax=Xenorhabdus bovienii str. kraussei Becker Underwood TaxID=1398204 RepID=A0A077Q118_XENBV|nr:hypothetical protein XBKB1_4140072 [Xenorhabdus bovienii str. kraussei Becker Underwood]
MVYSELRTQLDDSLNVQVNINKLTTAFLIISQEIIALQK